MDTEACAAFSLEAIVLAAGAARRFGGGKLTAPWRDGVLLGGALAAAFAAPVRRVVLVTGADAPAVEAAARAFAARAGETARLAVVHAPDHAEGMAASLRTGVAALGPDTAGAFVFLGDMPRVPAAVLAPLAQAVADGRAAAAPVFEGRRGHPAIFARRLFPGLLTLTGDTGARRVLDAADALLVEASDDGVLFDVDAPADLPK
jgi:molybdenum cofactor cytidylyltransferase